MSLRLALAALVALPVAALSGQASAAPDLDHPILVSGPGNSVAELRLTRSVQIVGLSGSARLAGPDGTFAGAIVRDASGRIRYAGYRGNVAGLGTPVGVDVTAVSTLPAGRYTVELLGDRPQTLRLAAYGLATERRLAAHGRTADRVTVHEYDERPTAWTWNSVLTLAPSTFFVTQMSGRQVVDTGGAYGAELCALPPSTHGCARAESAPEDEIDGVTFSPQSYTGQHIPGLHLLSTQVEEGPIGSTWEAVVSISAAQAAPIGHASQ